MYSSNKGGRCELLKASYKIANERHEPKSPNCVDKKTILSSALVTCPEVETVYTSHEDRR